MSPSFGAVIRLAALLLAVACGRITLSAPSGTESQRTLVGDWTVEFRLDSLRAAGQWSAASRQSIQGSLHLSDSDGVAASRIRVDFKPLLGRDMSCFDPLPTSTVITRAGENTSLHFTPGAADCGFGASGRFFGDSLIGAWSETSFAGPIAMGRFRMVRAR